MRLIFKRLNCEIIGLKHTPTSNSTNNLFYTFLIDTELYSIVYDKLCKGLHYATDPFHGSLNATKVRN